MTELQDLVALIRANTPLIVIETRDEARVVELFRQAMMQAWRSLYRWSITEGLRRLDLDREDEADTAPMHPTRCTRSAPPTSAASTCCSTSIPTWVTPAPSASCAI